ncbi:MAG: leucine-rich repeat protein [Clostridia bacterium]|nr:leucine-rich repeat protein [Clostridia bacterium]
MKHLITVCMAVFTLGCMAACGESRTPDASSSPAPTYALAAPKNVEADFWKLTWKEVDGATEYVVRIGEDEYETKENEFSLFAYLSPDRSYTIDVRAIGENGALSPWERISYHTESVTQKLTYTLLNDDTYEVSCMQVSIPADGRLVYPDYVNGKPVTVISPQLTLLSPTPVSYRDVTAVRLPKYLKTMTFEVFYEAKLEEVYLPYGVETVGGFYACKKLTSIDVPDSVITLARSAFRDCTALTEISLSENLQEIDARAFQGCTALTELCLPDGVATIGNYAFMDSGVTEIDLSKNLETVGNYAFANVALKELVLPAKLKEIGDYAFENTALTGLTIPKSIQFVGQHILRGTPWYEKQSGEFILCDDVLYEYRGSHTALQTTDFPQGVRLLAGNLFQNVPFTEVALPDSVQGIGWSAFLGCAALQNVRLPEGLLWIGSFAFFNCTALEEILLPESSEVIKNGAFKGSGLTGVTIPQNVRTIGGSAFAKCDKLTTVVFCDGITELGESLFERCSSLKNVTLPNTLTSIPRNMFYDCMSLTEIVIPDSVTWIDQGAFGRSGLESFALPNQITSVDRGAFANIQAERITLSKNLQSVAVYAFSSKALKSIVLPKEIKALEITAFFPADGYVAYPADTLNTFYYTGTEEEWTSFEFLYEKIKEVYSLYEEGPYFWGKEKVDAWFKEFEEKLHVYFYSEEEPSEKGNYWHYDTDGTPVLW